MARAVYSMDNLLTLVTVERAQELKLQVGTAPLIMLGEETHPLEGPSLTRECTETLLRSIAKTRHMRLLQRDGRVQFIYHFRGTSPFLVSAEVAHEGIRFALR